MTTVLFLTVIILYMRFHLPSRYNIVLQEEFNKLPFTTKTGNGTKLLADVSFVC